MKLDHPMQGVRPLAPNTIPQLNGAEPEPELGAKPDGKVSSDPEPAQPKDPGLEVVSCVCSSYNICLESVSCPMASIRRKIENDMQASWDRLNKTYRSMTE